MEDELNDRSIRWIADSSFLDELKGMIKWEAETLDIIPYTRYCEVVEGMNGSKRAIYKN